MSAATISPVEAAAGPTAGPRRRHVLRLGSVSVRFHPRALAVGLAMALVVCAVGVVTLGTGDYPISPADSVRTLLGGGTEVQRFIIETLRLPRLLTGIAVGAALGVGGALFQSVSRNPLGSPDIVGFNAGSATGALLVIVVEHGTAAQISLGAVGGGVLTALLVYLLAMKRGVSGYRLILIGIGVAALLEAVNSYLITRADITDAQSATVWLTGSLNGRGWAQCVPVALGLAVLLPVAAWLARDLRLMEHGDDLARSLGVRAEGVRLLAVVVGVGLSALATSAAGPVGFVALAAPQVARRLTGVPGPGILTAALTGAALLSGSDLAAQRLFPGTLPVGVATGVVGGLYLAALLGRDWRRGRG